MFLTKATYSKFTVLNSSEKLEMLCNLIFTEVIVALCMCTCVFVCLLMHGRTKYSLRITCIRALIFLPAFVCLCPSRGSVRSPEVSTADEQDDAARLEAERKLEELKRRRDDAESEEFERMRQKQQEAEVELEELKRKREERRKVLEEEERQRKQEEAERKAREEVGKDRVYYHLFVSFFWSLLHFTVLLSC